MNALSCWVGLVFLAFSFLLWLRAMAAFRTCARAFDAVTIEVCQRLTEGVGWQSERVASWKLFSMGAIGLSIIWIAKQYGDEDYRWLGAAGFMFFVGMIQILSHWTPATILVLGKSDPAAIELHRSILNTLMPSFRALSLLEEHDSREAPGDVVRELLSEKQPIPWMRHSTSHLQTDCRSTNVKIEGHCFRITSGVDWQAVVTELSAAFPLIVMDLREGTEATAWEFTHIVNQSYESKTVFLCNPIQVAEVAERKAVICQRRGEIAASSFFVFTSAEDLTGFMRFHLGRLEISSVGGRDLGSSYSAWGQRGQP